MADKLDISNIRYIAVGAVVAVEEEIERAAQKLIEKGKSLTPEGRKKMASAKKGLVSKGDEFSTVVARTVQRALENTGIVTRGDLEGIEKRVSEIEKKAARRKKPAAKKAEAKKAEEKKPEAAEKQEAAEKPAGKKPAAKKPAAKKKAAKKPAKKKAPAKKNTAAGKPASKKPAAQAKPAGPVLKPEQLEAVAALIDEQRIIEETILPAVEDEVREARPPVQTLNELIPRRPQ